MALTEPADVRLLFLADRLDSRAGETTIPLVGKLAAADLRAIALRLRRLPAVLIDFDAEPSLDDLADLAFGPIPDSAASLRGVSTRELIDELQERMRSSNRGAVAERLDYVIEILGDKALDFRPVDQ